MTAPQSGFLFKTLPKTSQKLLIPAAHVNPAWYLVFPSHLQYRDCIRHVLLKFFSSLSSRLHPPFPSLLKSVWDLAEDPPKEGLLSSIVFLWNDLQRVSIPYTYLWLFSLLEKN